MFSVLPTDLVAAAQYLKLPSVGLFVEGSYAWFMSQRAWLPTAGIVMIIGAVATLIVKEPSSFIPSGPAAGTFWIGMFFAHFHVGLFGIWAAVLIPTIACSVCCWVALHVFGNETMSAHVHERLTFAFVEVAAVFLTVPVMIVGYLFAPTSSRSS